MINDYDNPVLFSCIKLLIVLFSSKNSINLTIKSRFKSITSISKSNVWSLEIKTALISQVTNFSLLPSYFDCLIYNLYLHKCNSKVFTWFCCISSCPRWFFLSFLFTITILKHLKQNNISKIPKTSSRFSVISTSLLT